MNKEEITKEDILNVTGSVFDTMLDYVENSNNEIEQLQARIDKAILYIETVTDIVQLDYKEKYYHDLLEILKGEENE